jgi:hypothetical protein
VTEIAIVLFLVGLGAVAAVQEIRTRRWDPDFFRGGVTALKGTVSVKVAPIELHAPPGVRAHTIGPHELAFLAPVLNGSLMRGLLRYRPELSSLEVVGHLQWGMWSLFLAPILFGFWQFSVAAAVLLVWAYVGERRRFLAALDAAARYVASSGGP